MTQLSSVTQFLDSLLDPQKYQDASLNGLQVETKNREIKKVCFAVDAGLTVIEEAIQQEADLLVVHHGLFWGECQAIRGALGQKIHLLMQHGCSLYASHLPLDGNMEVGNAAEIARFLSLSQVTPFCEYKGATIGASGTAPRELSFSSLLEKLATIPGASLPFLQLMFGNNERCSRIAIVTGSGAFALPVAVQEGFDLFISGEPKHEVFHMAQELQANALFIGHYASETFGVRAVAERIEQTLELKTGFIDIPSGI
ncbi:MAG: Nif3-like dinuclear metal center hexameric protein [Bdellovibrionales bacterium]|nr:Nif3-like dinuclear metal center hexameric protein [Bdellovibrionales bacterium]